MPAQPSIPAVWAAVQSTVQVAASSVTGLSASSLPVIWKWQSAPQPALDYVALSLGSMITEGFDYTVAYNVPDWTASTGYAVGDRVIHDAGKTYTCTTAGTSAASGGPTGTGSAITDGSAVWAFVAIGGEVAVSVGGVREVAIQFEVWSASLIDEVAKATALAICDQIVTKFRLPTARASLAAVGISPFDPGPTNWIPSIVATGFRGRASCDYRCRVPARALTEYTSYIASIETTLTATGAGLPIVATIEAP